MEAAELMLMAPNAVREARIPILYQKEEKKKEEKIQKEITKIIIII